MLAPVEFRVRQKMRCLSAHCLANGMAIASACVFTFLAAYRIQLPGLYYDEVAFVNAAQGAPDNTFIYRKLGSVPVLIFPYMGALKAWIYAPIFHLARVSPLTIRLPTILLAALTLLIFYRAMRDRVGHAWAAIAVLIMAVDPANVFPSRLDWGCTVLMHLFQALILALWFSYRKKPQLWKPFIIFACFGLGFFNYFNFVWFLLAFAVGIVLCYPESLVTLWNSLPRFARWLAIALILIGCGAVAYLVLPLFYQYSPIKAHTTGLGGKWAGLMGTLSGRAVAGFIFGDANGIIPHVPFWLIVTDGFLALACLLSPTSDPGVRENYKNGFFCLLIASLIFVQIAITPQAGGPHHYSMIFPFPILAFVFLARSLYSRVTAKNLQRLSAAVLGAVALCTLVVNWHNTAVYLSHFRTNLHYNPRWSPEIYSLSEVINKNGFEAKRIISVDWGIHDQLHALAPVKLRQRMRDLWPTFLQLGQKAETERAATLRSIFPRGTSFVLTFAASKETFPETRRTFLAVLATSPELKSRLANEFWFGGEKIYELYEVTRAPMSTK
jgi:Dolichyl-phosphate-mannose-protein mannosyltransferase